MTTDFLSLKDQTTERKIQEHSTLYELLILFTEQMKTSHAVIQTTNWT